MCIFENRLVERGLGGSQAGPLARIHVGHFFARVCPLGGRPVSAFGVFSALLSEAARTWRVYVLPQRALFVAV